ncbi:hypothetical protein ID0476_06360 [Helicobacter pylori]
MLMTEHLIGWFLISFSGEFVIDMVFDKKVKSLKTRFGISIVNGISLLLGALHTHQCIYFLYGLLMVGCPFYRSESLAYW